MKNLYSLSLLFLISLFLSSSVINASEEVSAVLLLEQKKTTVPATHCGKTRLVLGGEEKDRNTERVCNLKKTICQSLNHRDQRVYYCPTCDKYCSMCVVGCKTDGCKAEQKRCWNHGAKARMFCEKCEEICPVCPQRLEEAQEELHVSCMVCLDEKAEDDADWVRFDDCKHIDSVTGKFAYNICTACVKTIIDEGDGNCPACRVPISYPKCGVCREYLGTEQESISYNCAGFNFFNSSLTHRCHPECLRASLEYTYKNSAGTEVFHCPLPHDAELSWNPNLEVEVSKVSYAKAQKILSKHVAEKAGNMQEDACALCHRVFEEKDDIVADHCETMGYGVPGFYKLYKVEVWHKYHNDCLQAHVNKAVFKKNGAIGIYCPVSHNHVTGNTKRFREILDSYKGIVIPPMFTATCILCNEELPKFIDSKVSTFNCFRPIGGMLTTNYEYHSYHVHVLCFAKYLSQKKKRVSEGLFTPTEVVSYPCPYHESTRKNHTVSMTPELAQSLDDLLKQADE